MNKTRLEAFSDAVIAIILTIMVLEIVPPHHTSLESLKPLIPVFLCYVCSFAHIGLYWNNHHHLFHASKSINGKVLWANMLLLFALSLMPFFTGWMGENHFEKLPVALYGVDLLFCSIAFAILVKTLLKNEKADSVLNRAIGNDFKGKLSTVIYLIAIPLSFLNQWIAIALYVIVFCIWFIPDTRIEKTLPKEV